MADFSRVVFLQTVGRVKKKEKKKIKPSLKYSYNLGG